MSGTANSITLAQYNTSAPSLSNGSLGPLQSDSAGNLITVVKDALLDCVLYVRYALTDDSAHTIAQAVAAFGASMPTSFRTVIIQAESNTVRLVDDGITVPSAGVNGAPLALGSQYAYSPVTYTKVKFCNAASGQNAIVHLSFYL